MKQFEISLNDEQCDVLVKYAENRGVVIEDDDIAEKFVQAIFDTVLDETPKLATTPVCAYCDKKWEQHEGGVEDIIEDTAKKIREHVRKCPKNPLVKDKNDLLKACKNVIAKYEERVIVSWGVLRAKEPNHPLVKAKDVIDRVEASA